MTNGIPRFLCYSIFNHHLPPYFQEVLTDEDWSRNSNGDLIIVDLYAHGVFTKGKHEPLKTVGVAPAALLKAKSQLGGDNRGQNEGAGQHEGP